MNLAERVVELDEYLERASIRHAFGGALALAWCTQRARDMIDIDLNLFVNVADAERVLDLLPPGITASDDDRATIARDGQARRWWDQTPVDVFFNTTAFHEQAASCARLEDFDGRRVPFSTCRDLAVFKAFCNRTKEWADLEEMALAGSLDTESVIGVLALQIGGDDLRSERLREIAAQSHESDTGPTPVAATRSGLRR